MGEFLTCRKIILIMAFTGFILHDLLKANLSIAIVEMTKISNDTIQSDSFNWTISEKNTLISSMVWGLFVGEIPGGRLSEKIGGRKTFGQYILFASLITLIFPTACNLNYYVACVTQFCLGFALGGTVSSSGPLIVNWFPPDKHDMFGTLISAISIGVACSMAISGLVIPTFGWRSTFYTTGCMGLIFCVLWFYLIYDTPDQHPRISVEEKNDVNQEIKSNYHILHEKPKKVPWLKILTCRPIWALFIAQWTTNFGYFILMSQIPMYLSKVLKFDIGANGLLSSLPFLGNCLVALLCRYLSEKMLKSGKISKRNIRRLFGVGAHLCCGIAVALLPLIGSYTILSVVVFITMGSLMGAVFSGHIACAIDMAPSFCATIISLVTFSGMPVDWLSTRCVTLLLHEENTFQNWSNVFWLMSAIYIVGGTLFGIFCNSDVQTWNYEK